MLKYSLLKQYNFLVKGIRFPIPASKDEPYLILYFSENSTFYDDYELLKLKKMDVKIVTIPRTLIPRTKLTPQLIKKFKRKGLFPLQADVVMPKGRNIVYDISFYLNAIDNEYRPIHYRQRAGKFIVSAITTACLQFPNYRRVLMYSIDVDKKIDNLIIRKIFPILETIKNETFQFDDLVLALVSKKRGTRYRLLIKNKKFTFDKVYRYLKIIKSYYEDDQTDASIDLSDERQEQIEDATNKINNNLVNEIKPKNQENVKSAIKDFLTKEKKVVKKILDEPLTQDVVHNVASASILYKVSGNISKSKNIVNKIVKKDIPPKNLFKIIDFNYTDQILEKPKIETVSEDPLIKSADLIKVMDNKIPTHLFQKRQIDFKTNLKEDVTNSFRVLQTKELPLSIDEINIVDRLDKKNEVNKSDISVINVTLSDDKNKHNVHINIPKIDPNSGTFRINGERKCLINQIILCPITFPKPYDAKFESSYSKFHIHSKRTRSKKYLDIYIIASYKNMSLFILMAYSFGFDYVVEKFGLKYEITKKKPSKNDFFCKINKEDYLLFHNVDTELKEEFVTSLIKEKLEKYNIDAEFGTKKYFNDLIIEITGKRNSTYMINSNLENIVDPVVQQVLINKQLPIKLDDIMYYMASKVVTGYSEERNDLSNQRIRGSEVIVHLLQKQILAAYTVYKQQKLSGNENAKFEINQTKLLSQFINSEIVSNMEYANPVEEMATMTRISPVGKSIGGIPDKRMVQIAARNVHDSYFGNIDPLDTPESENIGVAQQLTVDALVTSKRGLFATKQLDDKESSGILSTSSSMIPFIENNDGARIMMAANQAKQMLPLKGPTPPIVKSGYESILTNVLSHNFIKKSPVSGRILEANDDIITILGKNGEKINIDLTPLHLKSGTGKDTLSIFKVKVKNGQIVKQGQILAEGSCVENEEIALGRTLLIGLMPYKGYNFEDGIVINEKLIDSDKLTSLHGIIEEVLVSKNDRVSYICPLNTYLNKGEPLIKKSIGEIEELLGYDEEDGSDEISGQLYIKKSPGGRVVDIDVYCNVNDDKFPILKDYIDRTRKRYDVTPKDKFVIRGKTIEGVFIKFKIEQELKIGLGDKLCNRYGNKGIISLIEKDENMPKTPWGDTLDIILNPIGVVGRMNIGQLYEMYCGLISKALANKIIKVKNKLELVKILKAVLPLLDGSENQKFSKSFISNISKLSQTNFNKLISDIKETGFLPIIIPPFKAPSAQQIKNALRVMGLSPGYKLHLPEYNTKTVNEVPVGYMYISKLEHIGDMKIHSRSTGPTTTKYMQPTGGKSREGGQRVGEADTYAIISYNCPHLLAEFLGPLSDDVATKNEILTEIIQNGSAKYKIPKISPVKDLLASYFISLMLESSQS